jgi:hypothetical protein
MQSRTDFGMQMVLRRTLDSALYASSFLEKIHQLVGSLKAAPAEVRWRQRFQSFQLISRVGLSVNFRTLNAGVT